MSIGLILFFLSAIQKIMNNFKNNSNSSISEKLPPQSIEAEKSVLGSLMLDKNAIAKVADFLQTGDFYKKSNQEIYKIILEFFEKAQKL